MERQVGYSKEGRKRKEKGRRERKEEEKWKR